MDILKNRGADALIEELKKEYSKNTGDYFMPPLRPNLPEGINGKIEDGDSVVFGCRRGEREIELTEMFTQKDFNKVPIKHLNGVEFVLLTQYHEKFKDLPIAFGIEQIEKTLAQVLSENGKTQLHCAESEKYAHVTFFFNGGENKPFDNEEDFCAPSPKGIPFESKPELSLPLVVEKVENEMGKYDFIVVNFANGDVIGHTSDKDAKIKACSYVSDYLEKVVTAAMKHEYVIAITADHGNIEALFSESGKPHVAHTTNKVEFILIDSKNSSASIELADGSLKDVAPTILDAMCIEKPACMDGVSLARNYEFGKNRKCILLILDGWGIGSQDDNDAIYMADTPYWDYLLRTYSHSRLYAFGEYVGLGIGKPGNSEAGHMNLGAGRCVPQDDMRIDSAIANGSFIENKVIQKAIIRARQKEKKFHIITFLTYKSSHGSMDYAIETCRMAKKLGMEKVLLHIIFDGRSTESGSAPKLLKELESKLNEIGAGYIIDGIGRGLVLDRDKNYENVKLAYDMMTGC